MVAVKNQAAKYTHVLRRIFVTQERNSFRMSRIYNTTKQQSYTTIYWGLISVLLENGRNFHGSECNFTVISSTLFRTGSILVRAHASSAEGLRSNLMP